MEIKCSICVCIRVDMDMFWLMTLEMAFVICCVHLIVAIVISYWITLMDWVLGYSICIVWVFNLDIACLQYSLWCNEISFAENSETSLLKNKTVQGWRGIWGMYAQVFIVVGFVNKAYLVFAGVSLWLRYETGCSSPSISWARRKLIQWPLQPPNFFSPASSLIVPLHHL